MSYPQQPYPQQPQWGPPSQGAGPKPPSGGTTITAAILALISGLVGAFALVASLIAIFEYLDNAFSHPIFLISFGAQTISVLALLVGAVMLFARAGAGRIMIIIGTVVLLGLVVWSFIQISQFGNLADIAATGPTLIGLIPLMLALVASVLAILPPTGAYIAAKKRGPRGYPPPGYPPQPGYGPRQGYPPSGYGPPQH